MFKGVKYASKMTRKELCEKLENVMAYKNGFFLQNVVGLFYA